MTMNRAVLVAASLPRLAPAARTNRAGARHGTLRRLLSTGTATRSSRAPRGSLTLTTRRGYVAGTQNAHPRAPNAPVRDVGVIGGGLTGLTTAYYLAKRLPASAKITLYEGSDSLGGWIKTERRSVDMEDTAGIVNFERGPRTLTSLHKDTWRFDDLVFYELALDLGLEFVTPPDLPRYIYYPDRLVSLPPAASMINLFTEDLFQECLAAIPGYFFRRWQNKPMPQEDCSIAQWVREIMMSESVGENLVSAMVHGIYGGDIDKLSARSVFERFYYRYYDRPDPSQPELLVKARELDFAIAMSKDPLVRKMALQPKGSLIHFGPNGMDSLTKALEQALEALPNVTVKRNSRIERIIHDEKTAKVKIAIKNAPGKSGASSPQTTTALHDKVVSTLAGEELYRMCKSEIPVLASSHSTGILAVSLWYPEDRIKPPGFGYLIPRSVQREENPECALGVFFDTDVGVVGEDEPSGTKLFVLIGGHHWDGLSENPGLSLSPEFHVDMARSVVRRHLHIPDGLEYEAVADYHRGCIPQHYVGHEGRMREAHDQLLSSFGGRLAVAGGSFTNIGVMAAMRAGYDVVDAIVGSGGASATGLERFVETKEFYRVDKKDIPCRRLR